MSNLATLIQASAHHLPMIPDKSIQCVVTSPPYFGLRKYDGAQDVEWSEVTYSPMAGLPPLTVPAMTCPLGNEPTIEAYIGHLLLCAREWRRVMADDGVCWVNLGDSYAGNNNKSGEGEKRNTKTAKFHGGKAHFEQRRVTSNTGLPSKNLMLIPARFALAMQADGWIVRRDVIWDKPNPMTESVRDRPITSHEYIYLFSKKPRYFFDYKAVQEPQKAVSVARYKRGVSDNHKNLNGVPGQTAHTLANPRRNDKSRDVPEKRNCRSVWRVAKVGYKGAHFAAFPPKLVEPMIKAGTRAHDTVLDPFNGSGTTGRVAIKLGRKYIGVDLSAKYLDELAPERLTVQMELTA